MKIKEIYFVCDGHWKWPEKYIFCSESKYHAVDERIDEEKMEARHEVL